MNATLKCCESDCCCCHPDRVDAVYCHELRSSKKSAANAMITKNPAHVAQDSGKCNLSLGIPSATKPKLPGNCANRFDQASSPSTSAWPARPQLRSVLVDSWLLGGLPPAIAAGLIHHSMCTCETLRDHHSTGAEFLHPAKRLDDPLQRRVHTAASPCCTQDACFRGQSSSGHKAKKKRRLATYAGMLWERRVRTLLCC